MTPLLGLLVLECGSDEFIEKNAFSVRAGLSWLYRKNWIHSSKEYPLLLDIKQINFVHSNDEKDCLFQIVNFIDPGSEVLALEWGSTDHIVIKQHFCENLLLCSRILGQRTNYLVMTKSASSTIVKFMVLRSWI